MLPYLFNSLACLLGKGSSPDFMIIGAQKAGTTALFSILENHSRITGSLKKEIHFFDNLKNNPKHYYRYHAHFPLKSELNQGHLFFEATPSYLYHPQCAKRLFDYNSKLKLIIMLRDPVERAISAWTMFHYHFKKGPFKHLHDKRSFKEAISFEIANFDEISILNDLYGYVKRGAYLSQIEAYLSVFPAENIVFIDNVELRSDFQKTKKGLLSFLNLPYEDLEFKEKNGSRVGKVEYEEEREMLASFFKPLNDELYKSLGKEYSWQ